MLQEAEGVISALFTVSAYLSTPLRTCLELLLKTRS